MIALWLIRRAVKRLVIWIGFGAWLTEYCRVCGRIQPLVWRAPEGLWREINGAAHGILCPECFDWRARATGHLLNWHCDD